jgi:hypothetical protein
MKKPLLVLTVLLLCGCSTYKYQLGQPPNDKGYVVTRDKVAIPEYTVGKDKSFPDKKTAETRFKRRRGKVEYYYKKMGRMESRAKEVFLDPPAMLFKAIFGFFRLPFIAISDYKYDHNPQYREKMKKIEEQKDSIEQARIGKIRSELATYIDMDIAQEKVPPAEQLPAVPAPSLPAKTVELPPPAEIPVSAVPAVAAVSTQQEKVLLAQEKQIEKTAPSPKSKRKPVLSKKGEPVAIIVVTPTKGFSPLKVKFSGTKSYSRGSKIVAYDWDFGDGDTSTKPNPVNTYYSGSFMPQVFNVTLTVRDRSGNTATTQSTVEVMNK